MIKTTPESPLHKRLKTELQSITGPDTPQAVTASHATLTLDELMVFKSQPCPINLHQMTDPTSPSYQIHHSMEQPCYYSCSFSHSGKDLRRPVEYNYGQCRPKSDKQSTCLRPVYLGDNFGGEYCMNWVEYLYHPNIYKTIPCTSHNCNRRYCPKLHQG